MKKIHQLVLKSYLGPLVLTFFIIIFILMMNFVWRYIDELVGKGLEPMVIIELIMYATINMIPMGLPLAILLATIMTMGNLGENEVGRHVADADHEASILGYRNHLVRLVLYRERPGAVCQQEDVQYHLRYQAAE